MPEYQTLTDDEVLQIATEREQLTDDARMLLDSELARRKLSIKDIQSQKVAYDQAETLDRARRQHRILTSSSFDQSGTGIRFLGKRNLHRDPTGEYEQYDATKWVVVLWIPVFPIATFTVRRKVSRWMGIPFRSAPGIIARHPRNWEQILLTWVKTAAVLFALRLTYLVLIYHREWITR